MSANSPLLLVLRERGCLLEGEDAMLRSREAAALDARQQLAWLASNRRVGLFVTLFAGGLRLAVLAAASVAVLLLGTRGEVPLVVPVVVSLVLGAVVAWLAPQFVRRVRALGQRLPAWEEIAARVERG